MGKETEYKLEVGDLQLLDCILCSEPVASRMQAPFAYIRARYQRLCNFGGQCEFSQRRFYLVLF